MKDSVNKSTCMWERPFAGWANVRAKQFHACNNSEIATKTKMVLVQASMHVNERRHSNKSSKQHSHKRKHKKQQKC